MALALSTASALNVGSLTRREISQKLGLGVRRYQTCKTPPIETTIPETENPRIFIVFETPLANRESDSKVLLLRSKDIACCLP